MEGCISAFTTSSEQFLYCYNHKISVFLKLIYRELLEEVIIRKNEKLDFSYVNDFKSIYIVHIIISLYIRFSLYC